MQLQLAASLTGSQAANFHAGKAIDCAAVHQRRNYQQQRSAVCTTANAVRVPSSLVRRRARCSHGSQLLSAYSSDVVLPATDVPACTNHYESQVLGCLLGSTCGDVLGHPFEGYGLAVVSSMAPKGVRDFDMRPTWPLAGRYSGDAQLALAVAQTVVTHKDCSAADFAKQYLATYDATRGYRDMDAKVLDALQSGEDPLVTGSRYLLGGFSLSGAARVAPIALAYRHAPTETLRQAVEQALLCTHTHPIGVEGAVAHAAGVAFLSRLQRRAGNGQMQATPVDLLDHVTSVCSTDDMRKRLKVIRLWLPNVGAAPGPVQSWEEHLKSDTFDMTCKVARMVAEEVQTKSTQAVACALWALCCHWDSPEDAVICAVHLGGHTHNIAAMTGALAGALHGHHWIPARWWANLEDGPGGRNDIVSLARQLALLDLR